MGDLNGDGKIDIALTNNTEIFQNLSTTGTIDFSSGITLGIGSPYHICIADLNGDGKADLASAITNWYLITILTNKISATLPLSINYFKAAILNNQTQLQWQTAGEQNTAQFIIEYSIDGSNFSSVGNVAAAGNSNNLLNYSFTHAQPVKGTNYYRLKIIDKDGSFTYSKVVTINIIKEVDYIFLKPNPAKAFAVIRHPAVNSTVQINLIDVQGRVIKTAVAVENSTETKMELQGIASGIYKIVWSDGKNTQNKTLIVQ